jgi:predicted dehydrogenase
MRFLICGLGSIGRRHLRNLKSLGEEDLVFYRTGMSTLPDDDLPDVPVERDLERALDRWKPDAVIIANPTAHHLDVALPAAEAGCHLFIEKPISHSLSRLVELREALRKEGKQAFIGYQFRFHPGLRQVKRLLEDSAIGEVICAHANWGEYLPGWHPWEDYRISYSSRHDLGGGVVLTLCHPFDYLRWLLGEVVQVSAEVNHSGLLEVEVEDVAEVVLRFASGSIAGVHLDYVTRPASHWLQMTGSRGSLRWDNADGAVRWWSIKSEAWLTMTAPEGFERNRMFLDEMRHFREIISGKVEPLCSLEDGVRALEIALAVHQSSESGKRISMSDLFPDGK